MVDFDPFNKNQYFPAMPMWWNWYENSNEKIKLSIGHLPIPTYTYVKQSE